MKKTQMTVCMCGKPIRNGQAFCSACGKIIRDLPQSAKEEYEAQVRRLIECINLSAAESCEPLWDAVTDMYASTVGSAKPYIEAIADALSTETERVEFSTITRKIDTFITVCKRQDFEIALVGAVKAGKSTLINALFDRELASTSVAPETASLTKFRSSDKNYVRVTFYRGDEWHRLWQTVPQETNAAGEYLSVFMSKYHTLNAGDVRARYVGAQQVMLYFDDEESLKTEIGRWTSARQPEHYFVKEVEVGLADFDLPPHVVLVDTPGLNDPVTYRSDITKDYVESANAVLVCVKAAVLSEPELQTIRAVFANTDKPEKVYVIGTQLDTLNAPAQHNWDVQRHEWIQHLRMPQCFNGSRLAEKNVVGVAAYLYTMVQKRSRGIELVYNDALDEEEILRSGAGKYKIRGMAEIDANVAKLIDLTNIPALKSRLYEEVVDRSKYLLSEEIEYRYKSRKAEIERLARGIREQQSTMLTTFEQAIDVVEQEKASAVERFSEMEATQHGLESLLQTLSAQTKRSSDDLAAKIKEMKVDQG